MAAQIAGGEDIPKADVVIKWTFEIGKTLVPPRSSVYASNANV